MGETTKEISRETFGTGTTNLLSWYSRRDKYCKTDSESQPLHQTNKKKEF